MKDKYGNYDNIVYSDEDKSSILEYGKLKNDEDYFTYKLSDDGKYYIITGMSKLGQAVMDVYENKIRQNDFYYSVFLGSKLSIEWKQNVFYNSDLNFDLHLPSLYRDLPVKALGDNALASLDYYSYHLYIPESITRFGTNCVRPNIQIRKISPYLFLSGYHGFSILTSACITWNIGEEELQLSPYAFILQSRAPFMKKNEIILSENNSKYCYEDSILYSIDKSQVYFGFDFSSWINIEQQQGAYKDLCYKINYNIPNTIKEIKPGFMMVNNVISTFNCNQHSDYIDVSPELLPSFPFQINIPASLEKLSVEFFEYVNFHILRNLTYLTRYISWGTSSISSSSEYGGLPNDFLESASLGQGIIQVEKENKNFFWEDGALYNSDKTILYAAFVNKDTKQFVVDNTVEEISNLIFFINQKKYQLDEGKNKLVLQRPISVLSSTLKWDNFDLDSYIGKVGSFIKVVKHTFEIDFSEMIYQNIYWEFIDYSYINKDYLFKDIDLNKQQNYLFIYKSKIEKVTKVLKVNHAS